MACYLDISRIQPPTQISRAPACTRTIPVAKRAVAASKLHAQGRRMEVTSSNSKEKQRLGGNNSDEEDEGIDEEDEIPEAVFNRMLVRAFLFVGVPMASGVGLLYVLSALKERGIWVSPGWLPLLTLLLSFGTSALGIAYGTLSSSWDPDEDGSMLGWEQVQKNWPEIWKEEEDEKR